MHRIFKNPCLVLFGFVSHHLWEQICPFSFLSPHLAKELWVRSPKEEQARVQYWGQLVKPSYCPAEVISQM